MKNFIAYYRVSTKQQQRSGLGLDAQKSKVADFVLSVDGNIQDEFIEVESGGLDERPQLIKALSMARLKNATLVISKLDRLSRDVAYIATLMKNTNFVVAEMPSMNNFTMHIFSALAEEERNLISQRTKEGLKAAKERGQKLGNPNLKKGHKYPYKINTETAHKVNKSNADAFAKEIMYQIDDIKNGQDKASLAFIANALNEQGILTRRKKQWSKTSVSRIIKRCSVNDKQASIHS